jgi:cytoskeletal protein CcmA (bactofilin family)
MFTGKENPQTAASGTSSSASTKIDTVIGSNANFKGAVRNDGGMRIDGIFEGTIELTGNLVIGETGKVIADVTAQNVSVSGAIKGTLNVTGRLEIMPTGKVWGNVIAASFLLDEGGFFRGQSSMPGELDFPMLDAAGHTAGPVING